MFINPNEVLVKRSDLLPVTTIPSDLYRCGETQTMYDTPVEYLRTRAYEFLSIAVQKEDAAAAKAAQEAAEWELEHAVPLARMMYNTFHKSSDNYKDDASEELWLQRFKEGHHLVMKWVRVATATLKAQESGA